MKQFVVDLNLEEELLRQAIEPLLDNEGFELVKLKLKKAMSKSILAIFVDTRDQKNGIKMEHLEDVSRLLSDVLDAAFAEATVLKGQYDLEVSSPGLDRPLTKETHFRDAVHEKVKVRLKNIDEAGAKKNILGILQEVSVDGLVIQPEHKKEEKVNVAFKEIFEAHIVFDFSKVEPKKKSASKKDFTS